MFHAMTARELAPPEANVPASLSARYRSLFVIGRGGMGSVEAALEIETSTAPRELGNRPDRGFERIVALKRLLPDAARDKRRVDMFLREARLAAMLKHPNIVRAFDYGEIDGELYLSMEYVEGQPLSRVLRTLAETGEQMSPALTAHVLREICRGLHAAHELVDPKSGQPLQLVHRDVSPQNVMLGYDGRVRLLDFGVAKIETENVTRTGEVKGKTAYMSPEQAMGEPLDRRSDLFGVGAILFECLALRRMWGDGTDMEVIRRLALENPPPLETARSVLPDGMSDLYGRLVARDVKGRPATALEVADGLASFIDDEERASRELRELLARRFADQAREQRARLTASLDHVAPAQADELRRSILPPKAADASARPQGVDDASTIDARTTDESVRGARGRKKRALLTMAAFLAVSIIAARYLTKTTEAPARAEASGIPTAVERKREPGDLASPSASGSSVVRTADVSSPPSASAPIGEVAPTTERPTQTTMRTSAPVQPMTAKTKPTSTLRQNGAAKSSALPPSPTVPSHPPSEPARTPSPPDVDDHPF